MSRENVDLVRQIYVREPFYAVEPGNRRGRASFRVVRETCSGVPVEGEHGYVWTIRDGLAVRFQWFQSHREAFEAAGIEPDA